MSTPTTENPLGDIHNTREIRYVMKDGALHDVDTRNEISPSNKKVPRGDGPKLCLLLLKT